MVDEKKILIVDDEDTIRDVLETAFSKAGYCVRLATGAEEALEVLRKEYIPSEMIKIIVTVLIFL
jgi:DNA-binding NtrC family response regulator